MKAQVTKIDLQNIDEHDARELLNELNAPDIVFHADKYPRLREFQRILTGRFSSSVHDVHFISKRESK